VQHQRVDAEHRDEQQLGLQLRVAQVVGVVGQAEPDQRGAGGVQQQQRDRDQAHHEGVRRRDAHTVVGQLAEQADVRRDDRTECQAHAEQVDEQEQEFEHVGTDWRGWWPALCANCGAAGAGPNR
jgi:hypothetical protein